MTTTLVDDLRTARSRGVRPEAPDADLRGADLRDADLCDAYLRGAYLRGADLCGANLRGAYLRDADLCDADLRDADLRGADLRDAYLRGADLRDADLRGAYLRGAYLRDADLRDADLRGADWRDADWRGLHIDGLPSGQVTLTPTPEGWDLTIGCWQHKTLADLAALIAGEITPPEARGPEIERRRPSWVAVLALCEAHAGMHPDVIEALAAKWGQAS